MEENNDPNEKKRMLDKKINHYLWSEEEIEKVKEGKFKGWKEHKIKNHYFPLVDNPTKHHIKTLLNKIGKKKKKKVGGFNLNRDSSAHGLFNQKEKKNTKKEKKKKNISIFFLYFSKIDECNIKHSLDQKNNYIDLISFYLFILCFTKIFFFSMLKFFFFFLFSDWGDYYVHYFKGSMFLMIRDLPDQIISDMQITETKISYEIKINGPNILDFCNQFDIPYDNDNLEVISRNFRSRSNHVHITPKFKLIIKDLHNTPLTKRIIGDVSYFIHQIPHKNELTQINIKPLSEESDDTDSDVE